MAFRCIGWNTGIYPEIGQLFGSLLTLPPQPLFPYSELKQNWGKERSNIYVRTGRLFWERWSITDLRDAWTPYSVLHFFFCSLPTHFLLPPPVHNRRKLNPREVAPPLGTFTKDEKGTAVTFKIYLPIWGVTFCLLTLLRQLQGFTLSQTLVNFHWQRSLYYSSLPS